MVYSGVSLWSVVFLTVSAGSPGNSVSVRVLWDGVIGMCLEAL